MAAETPTKPEIRTPGNMGPRYAVIESGQAVDAAVALRFPGGGDGMRLGWA
jgi:hypothetical protein